MKRYAVVFFLFFFVFFSFIFYVDVSGFMYMSYTCK